MTLRPLTFNDYIGQTRMKQQLMITMGACRKARKQLPHLLFSGPPGLGKTTIAKIIANEYGVGYHEIIASSLNTQDDLEMVLAQLSDSQPDVLFIDEIHRLPIKIEELMYTVMEDFIFEGEYKVNGISQKRRLWVPKFALIGATTLAGDINRPLRDRFGIVFDMQNYSVDETQEIVRKLAIKREIKITEEATLDIARRSKGVARIAINYLNRCLEYAQFIGDGTVNEEATVSQFALLGIDEMGLDDKDYTVLQFLAMQTSPVGLDTISTGTNIDKGTVANIIEPYLVQKNLMNRTRSGRMITDGGLRWICSHTDIAEQLPSQRQITNNDFSGRVGQR